MPILSEKQVTIHFEVLLVLHEQLLSDSAHLGRPIWWTIIWFRAYYSSPVSDFCRKTRIPISNKIGRSVVRTLNQIMNDFLNVRCGLIIKSLKFVEKISLSYFE